MLRFGQQARLLNQLLIGTEGVMFFHTKAVYTMFVLLASPSFRLGAGHVLS